jgi:cell division septal protein FtsQ
MLCSTHPPTLNHEEKKVMAMQEQERKARRRKRFRLLVIYPVAWIVVSVILYYVTRIN